MTDVAITGETDRAGEVLSPGHGPFPAPVERSMVLRSAMANAAAQAEMMRYLVHGPFGETFAFADEVAAQLAEGLRQILEVEAARFDASSGDPACSVGEREALGQLLGSIERFQEVWGRG